MSLGAWGWSEHFEQAFALSAAPGLIPARVMVQLRGGYHVHAEEGEFPAEVSGRFRHQCPHASGYPVVGDWVVIGLMPNEHKAVIHAVLPRRTKFSRTAAGDATEEQILAANIDDVFVVEALDDEPNLRRLERFLTLACESGATPAILLTKADLCADPAAAVAQVQAKLGETPVIAISSVSGAGMRELRSLLGTGRTSVLLGPSGVGKSTLTNALFGDELLDTQPARESDSKGRHTTTHRELILLPTGGCIIDTPGLRELQLWDGETGVKEAYADVEAIASGCRFTDCRHESEPNCAVLYAVKSGVLDPGRLESHRKLVRELESLEMRQDVRARADQRRQMKVVQKSLRQHFKQRPRD
ncbi:MAG: ribosome small subunit-dependent GTPase A [Verrucomicrobia bacterium]|nr:ribosome small subunit-dependent GTPase A [Verrucomicrobiota bacterium]